MSSKRVRRSEVPKQLSLFQLVSMSNRRRDGRWATSVDDIIRLSPDPEHALIFAVIANICDDAMRSRGVYTDTAWNVLRIARDVPPEELRRDDIIPMLIQSLGLDRLADMVARQTA